MTQILLNDVEQNIIVHLESNTVLPGTYVNAEYQQPEDYKIKQLEKIADMVNTTIANASRAELSLSMVQEVKAKSMPLSKDMTKAVLTVSNTGITYDFNVDKAGVPVVSTYDAVMDHFTPTDDKVFVTGITSSKFDVIDKYFPKTNVVKTVEKIRPKMIFAQTNYATRLNLESRFNVMLERDKEGNQRINLSEIKEPAQNKPNKTNISLSAAKETKISRFVGDSANDNKPVALQENLVDNKLVRLYVKFNIPGLNIMAMILKDEPTTKLSEYVLYLDTPNPIKYVDLGDGTTIFTYLRVDDLPDTTANMVLFDGYSEEPKILSEVFIDRGVNSPFERVKKLKNTKNLNELTKNGLGFYKINTKGYNFKNL